MMMTHVARDLCHRGPPCRVIAHRGYSSAFAENTLEAYEQAIAAGADFVEIDLRVARDGAIVCCHDAAVRGAKTASLTTRALAEYGVVDLASVLPKLFDRACLVLDLKLPTIGLAAGALELLRRNSMESQAVIGVRSLEQAAFVRGEAPECVILGLLAGGTSFHDFYARGGDIARLWEDDAEVVRLTDIQDGGHPVWVTAGSAAGGDRPGDIDPPRLRRLFERGVDGILVNDPAQAIRVRESRAYPARQA